MVIGKWSFVGQSAGAWRLSCVLYDLFIVVGWWWGGSPSGLGRSSLIGEVPVMDFFKMYNL